MADTKKVSGLYQKILGELSKTIIGKDEIKKILLLALIAGGHVLIEGFLGSAKTKLARSFAEVIGGNFKRIQFTPDLLPSDITGTSTGKPPACQTPSLTFTARSRRCEWQVLRSLQVLRMPITGLSQKSSSAQPIPLSRDR